MKRLLLLCSILLISFGLFGLIFRNQTVVHADQSQSNEPVSVTVISYFDPQNIINTTLQTFQYGDLLSFDHVLASPPTSEITYTFLYWVQNGRIVEKPVNSMFYLTKENVLQAVFSPDNFHVVTMVDPNGAVLKIEYVSLGQDASLLPHVPNKLGYVFSGYSQSLENIQSDAIVYLTYELANLTNYSITVINGESSAQEVPYNGVVSVNAPSTKNGQLFSHWAIVGKVVSYQNPYTFTVLTHTTVEAVYADEVVQEDVHILISDNLAYRYDQYQKTYRGRIEVPSQYTIIEYGLLTHPFSKAILTLDTPGIHRLPSRRLTPNTQEFLMSIASSKAQTVRGYLIVKDSKGLLKTVYSESIYYIENGSFENGDLSGWTSFQTWKDESGLSAFRSERVVHSGNYGSTNSNPYDAVGNYLFGLYVHPYDNGNKDLNQERMGSLRSSNFVIAGSGVISFKLGGGKNPGTAYVSVRDASNDVEIERYANRHFFNNSIASQQFGGTIVNSEGFLFQYFANLSAHLGKEVYLVFEDAASHEWNVLAIDHVITYYPVLPVVSLDQTAVNILPVIANKGVATNSIPNGTLSSNLNQWENPQGVYQISNGGAISSVGGNGALGVLRSPAFHVNGVNKYLQFDFAGAISKDKQVFVLVKEVGTNQEVLRLVRRNDQANRTDSGDFRTHWYDLSVLSTEKEYYLEVVDNRNGDWGVALIRNVSLTSTPLQEYQLAVNAFYGIAQVSTSTGDHRQLQLRPQESNHDQSFWVVSNLGEEASDSVWINYHSLDVATRIEYTRASDVFFHQSSFIVPNSKEFFSSISSSGGITYGFTNRKIYSAQITNLDPNQQYIYRIHNGAFASQVYSFQTAPVQETFQFVYFTDTQSLQQTHVSIIDGLLSRVKSDFPEVAFGMISGDLVERGSASMHWDYFFEARANRFSLMSVPGNHDYFTHIEQLQSAQYYNLLFANPQNGRSEFLNSSYFIKYSNTLFIFLDVVKGEYTSEQIAWLQQVVNQHRQDFVIVSMHYSAYGTTHTSTATTIKTTWAPIFENLDIDLVFSGHDHVYARTPQMKNGVESIDVNEGTIYLIGGSGSHKLYSVPQNNTTFEFYLVPTVSTASVVTISSEAILVQTINKSGVILDSFSIPKKNITP